MTAFGDGRTHATAERLRAPAMLDKPFEIAEFLSAVDALFDCPASND